MLIGFIAPPFGNFLISIFTSLSNLLSWAYIADVMETPSLISLSLANYYSYRVNFFPLGFDKFLNFLTYWKSTGGN